MLAGVRSMRFVGRIAAVLILNGALLTLVGYAFWVADWQYALPTPRPDGLVQIALGSQPKLVPALASMRHADRPLLIHFASAVCACTEFNLDHVRKLQQQFGSRVDFVTVLESSGDPSKVQREFDSLHLKMPFLLDRDAEIGAGLGVYGTPQAVLLDVDGRLYFRGNYNRSRYCVDEQAEYVRLALTALVGGRPLPMLPADAVVAYGCPFPHRGRS